MDNIEATVLALARVYKRACAGCCLHILADDGNTSQSNADFCLEQAEQQNHADCWIAAGLLNMMTDAEREQIYNRYADYRA